jgi:hypothetical protein
MTEEACQKVLALKRWLNASAVKRRATPMTVNCTTTGAPHVAIWTLPLPRWRSCSATATVPLGSGRKRRPELCPDNSAARTILTRWAKGQDDSRARQTAL